jgi:hypothetical protein
MRHRRRRGIPQPPRLHGGPLLAIQHRGVAPLARLLGLLLGLGVLSRRAVAAERLVAPALPAETVLEVLQAARRHGAVDEDDVGAVALAVAAARVAPVESAVRDDVPRRDQVARAQRRVELHALVSEQGAHRAPPNSQ